MATFPADSKVAGISTGLTSDLNSVYGLLQSILGPVILPSGDATGTTDTAAITAALSAANIVHLLPGTYYISAPIALASNQVLRGAGQATIIEPGSGWTGSQMIGLASTSAVQVTIRDLYLSGGFTTSLEGINLTGSGTSDPNHLIDNVTAYEMGSHGFYLGASTSGTRLRSCIALSNLGDGFYLGGADAQVTNCQAGGNDLHGFVAGENCQVTNSKAWYSGHNAQTNSWDNAAGCGFFIPHGVNYGTITNCSAQQNALHGIQLGDGSTPRPGSYTIMACEIDTNSAYSSGVGSGIEIDNAVSCVVMGNVGGNNAGLSPGSQLYGIEATGTCTQTQIIANQLGGSATALFNNNTATGYFYEEGITEGTATLVSGTVVVSTGSVTATTKIALQTVAPGGTAGALFVSAVSAGTSFTIKSTAGSTDSSVVGWKLYQPG